MQDIIIPGLLMIAATFLVLAYTAKVDSNLKYYVENCQIDHEQQQFTNCTK